MSQNASIKQAFIKCQHTKGKESIGTLKQPSGEGEVEERAEHFLTCFMQDSLCCMKHISNLPSTQVCSYLGAQYLTYLFDKTFHNGRLSSKQ